MAFFRVTLDVPQKQHLSHGARDPNTTVVFAADAAEARRKGLAQIGVKDAPEGGVSVSGHPVFVGTATRQEFIDSEVARLKIKPEDVEVPAV